MCVRINNLTKEQAQEMHNNPLIALADIPCFKYVQVEKGPLFGEIMILGNAKTAVKLVNFDGQRYFSPYRGMEYELGEIYEQDITTRYFPNYHFPGAEDFSFENYFAFETIEGLYSSIDPRVAHSQCRDLNSAFENKYIVVHAVVPKGSKYFYSDYLTKVCSNQLLLTKPYQP